MPPQTRPPDPGAPPHKWGPGAGVYPAPPRPINAWGAQRVQEMDLGPLPPSSVPAVGDDVTALMGGGQAPPIGADVTALMAPGSVQAAAAAAPARTWGDTAKDVTIGVGKGLANTAFGLGKVVHDYTPIGRISDAIQPGAFEERPDYTVPGNAAQQVGFTAEQVGEYFVPAGTAVKAGKAVRVAKDAALAYTQSGSPVQAGVSGALTAVLPGASAVKRAAGALEQSAESTMAQALGATKEWAKQESERLAPEVLKRGIGGSIPAMRDLARKTAEKAGQNLHDAYTAAAAAGESVSSNIIRGNVQLASDTLHVRAASGARIPVPGYEPAIAQLAKLDEFVGQLGVDIPVDKAAFVKRAWDDIVGKAGLYGHKETASASEKAMAWSFREAANSFRELLNTNPTIAKLNAEDSFWIGLRNVLDATKLRKVGQGGGLVKAGAATVGAGVGAMTGDSPLESAFHGVLGGIAGQQFVKIVQSPTFRSKVSAPLKQALADALASGNAARITSAMGRITAAMPAQVRTATAQ